MERDNFTCQYCGQHAPNVTLEVDHIVPVCNGGEDSLDNLKTSCSACNGGKNAALLIRRRGEKESAVRVYKPPAYSLVPNRQERALEVIAPNHGVTAKELAQTMDISFEYACKLIYRLKIKGEIYKTGRQWFTSKINQEVKL